MVKWLGTTKTILGTENYDRGNHACASPWRDFLQTICTYRKIQRMIARTNILHVVLFYLKNARKEYFV